MNKYMHTPITNEELRRQVRTLTRQVQMYQEQLRILQQSTRNRDLPAVCENNPAFRPQTSMLYTAFIEAPSHILNKQEITHVLWRRESFESRDENVYRAISDLRKALADFPQFKLLRLGREEYKLMVTSDKK